MNDNSFAKIGGSVFAALSKSGRSKFLSHNGVVGAVGDKVLTPTKFGADISVAEPAAKKKGKKYEIEVARIQLQEKFENGIKDIIAVLGAADAAIDRAKEIESSFADSLDGLHKWAAIWKLKTRYLDAVRNGFVGPAKVWQGEEDRELTHADNVLQTIGDLTVKFKNQVISDSEVTSQIIVDRAVFSS